METKRDATPQEIEARIKRAIQGGNTKAREIHDRGVKEGKKAEVCLVCSRVMLANFVIVACHRDGCPMRDR